MVSKSVEPLSGYHRTYTVVASFSRYFSANACAKAVLSFRKNTIDSPFTMVEWMSQTFGADMSYLKKLLYLRIIQVLRIYVQVNPPFVFWLFGLLIRQFDGAKRCL